MYMYEHNLCLEEYLQGIGLGTIELPEKTETENVELEEQE